MDTHWSTVYNLLSQQYNNFQTRKMWGTKERNESEYIKGRYEEEYLCTMYLYLYFVLPLLGLSVWLSAILPEHPVCAWSVKALCKLCF